MIWGPKLIYAGLAGLCFAIALDVYHRRRSSSEHLVGWRQLLRLRLYAVSVLCIVAGVIVMWREG